MKTTETIGQLVDLDLAQIDLDPKNRKEHDKASLASLAASIKSEGLLEPLVVRAHPQKSGRYMLIAGERRLRALQQNKATKAPCRIVAHATEDGAARKRLVENMQRENLTPIEEARGFRELCVDHGMTQAAVAALANRSQPYVANTLRLLELPAWVQEVIQAGKLPRAHGIALARFAAFPKICAALAAMAQTERLSSKDLERGMPMDWELRRQGLIVAIETASWAGVQYEVPAALQKDPAFMKVGQTWYCLEPAKWLPEKERQDKARAEKEAKAKAADRLTPHRAKAAQQLQKKKAENKKARQQLADALKAAQERLGAVKAFDPAALRVVAAQALEHYTVSQRFEAAAAAVGVNLPKNFDESQLADLAKLDPVDLLVVTAAAICQMHAHYAHQSAAGVPEQITHLLAKGGRK